MKFPWQFNVYWRHWAFGKTMRLNGSLMWGWNPYTSYRLGPLEWRKYL